MEGGGRRCGGRGRGGGGVAEGVGGGEEGAGGRWLRGDVRHGEEGGEADEIQIGNVGRTGRRRAAFGVCIAVEVEAVVESSVRWLCGRCSPRGRRCRGRGGEVGQGLPELVSSSKCTAAVDSSFRSRDRLGVRTVSGWIVSRPARRQSLRSSVEQRKAIEREAKIKTSMERINRNLKKDNLSSSATAQHKPAINARHRNLERGVGDRGGGR